MNRKEYMEAKSGFPVNSKEDRQFHHNLHNEYYQQFVKVEATCYLGYFTKKAMSYRKTESSLNCIPLTQWDALGSYAKTIFDVKLLTKMEYPTAEEGKVYCSKSDIVCISKVIVRGYLLQNGYTEVWERNRFGNYEAFLVKEGE